MAGWCSPHPRGDGPADESYRDLVTQFSPPAWGWSDEALTKAQRDQVLPTRVGMVRCRCPASSPAECSPHPRGDGPQSGQLGEQSGLFSPPAWGWSAIDATAMPVNAVLPTRVGMVRSVCVWVAPVTGSPHPRGDGPQPCDRSLRSPAFSPPAWGWSACWWPSLDRHTVLPTRVGMVRIAFKTRCVVPRSPHPRGDGPQIKRLPFPSLKFSPPAWGWSAPAPPTPSAAAVLPTRVGMVRCPSSITSFSARSPHPRGDGPQLRRSDIPAFLFSPPAWGWSEETPAFAAMSAVLPTRVGMVQDTPTPAP